MGRSLCVAAGMLGALFAAVPAGAHAQVTETTIAQEQGDTLVATYAGWLVWSSYDTSTYDWHLVGRSSPSSPIERVPVAPRPIPFDVDLGPDAQGRVVAVYSRCTQEPTGFSGGFRYARHRAGRGCRIVKLDLSTGRESTLYRRSGASLIYPTIWRDRLAYVVRGRSGRDLHLEQRVRRDARTSTTVLGRAPAESTESPNAGPTRLDLYGKHLVFAWENAVNGCPGSDSSDDGYGPYTTTRVYLQRGNTPRRLLDKGCSSSDKPGDVAGADAPSISGGVVNWIRVVRASGGQGDISLRRRSLRTGNTTQRTPPSRWRSLAADGRTVYALASEFRIVAARVRP